MAQLIIARYCFVLALVVGKLARAQGCYTDCFPVIQYFLSSCLSNTVKCECLAFNEPDYISCLQSKCPASLPSERESLELVCATQGVTLVPIFSSSTTTRRPSTSTSATATATATATDDQNQTSTTPTQTRAPITSTANHRSSSVTTTASPSSPDTSSTGSSSAPAEPSKPALSVEAIISISVTVGGIVLATVLAIPMIHYARRSHRGGEGRSNATAGTDSRH